MNLVVGHLRLGMGPIEKVAMCCQDELIVHEQICLTCFLMACRSMILQLGKGQVGFDEWLQSFFICTADYKIEDFINCFTS